jgi:hypothetical protein
VTWKFWRRWLRRGLPPMKLERLPGDTYDAATGYALLADAQLPTVNVDEVGDES